MFRFVRAMFLIVALASVTTSFAQTGSSAALSAKIDIFSRIYNNSSAPQFFYHPGFCSSNIFNLSLIFNDLDLIDENDKVVVIYNESRETFLVTEGRVSQKLPVLQPFVFHVIYVSEGHVFDFDYGQVASVEDVVSYLAGQFSATDISRLKARVYSERNYFKTYNGAGGNHLILDLDHHSDQVVDLAHLADFLKL